MELETLEPVEDEVLDLDAELYIPQNLLSAGQILILERRILRNIDPLFIDIAEKTAFCAMKIFEYAKLDSALDRNTLFMLSLFFSIAAYNKDFKIFGTEELISDKLSKPFLYSYLYLKHMSPLNDASQAYLFFDTDYKTAGKTGTKYYDYSALIFTCARICLSLSKSQNKNQNAKLGSTIEYCRQLYGSKYPDLFLEANLVLNFTHNITDGSYITKLDDMCMETEYSYDDTFMLLKMLLYTIDFRSTSTVTHIISTAFLATDIAENENLDEVEIDELFTAALIHDLGKTGIHQAILEMPGKLNDVQMEEMRSHALQGDNIYRGIVSDKIADIASHHHEYLDGLGYPKGLTGEYLGKQERILTIADVFSALTDARSYKPSFPKEKTCEILLDMAKKGKTDINITDRVIKNYDYIKANTDIHRGLLQSNLGQVILNYIQLQDYSDIQSLFAEINKE